jgi:hypothetical protein
LKDIALHILDIVQNSIYAGASMVEITVIENTVSDEFKVIISDNGNGMEREMLNKVTDPFFTSRKTRKVGLGIPLLKSRAEQAGGSFLISSVPGKGTELIAIFGHSHLDRPPKGDVAGVISILAGANPGMDFVFRHWFNETGFVFDTREAKEILEGVSLQEPAVMNYIKEMIRENMQEIMPD